MHVCICRNFNDTTVKKAIAAHPDTAEVKDIYEICSGGEKPQCGKCLPAIRDIKEAFVPLSALKR